jgi:hypothetical protein
MARLVETYLQNRYKRVHILNSHLNSNTVSKWTKIKYGVSQGSILGPLQILVYINDLPRAVEHKALPILFTNDTGVLLTNPNNTGVLLTSPNNTGVLLTSPNNTGVLLTSPNNIHMQREFNSIFEQLIGWFKSN